MTTLGTNTLTGSPTATKEIAGDTTYAQGRWVQGTVTTSSGASTLTGSSNNAYHYVVHNQLATFPATATVTCSAARLTAPTYISGGAAGVATAAGTATGTGTLSFGATGAAVSVTVNAAASGSSGSVTGTSTIASPTATNITGNFLGGGAGTQLTVADGGAMGMYTVVAGYKVALANGALHQGVATFHCM